MKNGNSDLEAIFWKAVELSSPGDRADFLELACGENIALRQEVEKLLEAHPHANDFLEQPAVLDDVSRTLAVREKPGTVLGNYELLEEIGEGGMGVVYKADQLQPIKRNVALKIIKPGMDSQQVISRFDRERQTLALMNHPNIAKVYDADCTESGRPFFVMELVDGSPITEFCDQHRFTTTDRLKLFSQLCHALQHAHQKGVIHRDLKPNNILITTIDAKPAPKIIDFGVAKAIDREATEQTLFTNLGQMVGTPLYMSPEQAAMNNADVDTRSDIYSLGVLLYELLTGKTPFEKDALKKAGYDEMRRMIREDDPETPSSRISTLGETLDTISSSRSTNPKSLSQILRHDLDWVVMKALEKERSRRYQTATDFAKDIERFLDDQPVEARPPSSTYRLQKYVKRNKVFVTATIVVVIAIFTGSGVSIWQALLAQQRFLAEQDARSDAEKKQIEADVQRERAESALLKARETINDYVETLQNTELLKDARFRPVMKELMKDALDHYFSLIDDYEFDDDTLNDLSKRLYKIGWTNGRIGDNETANKAYQKSIEISQNLVAENPNRLQYRTQLAASSHNIGSFYQQRGDFSNALLFFRNAHENWSHLARVRPDEVQFQRNLAGIIINIGNVFWNQGKIQEALAEFLKAKSIIDINLEIDPSHAELRQLLVTTSNHIGRMYRNLGQSQRSMEYHLASTENAEKLSQDYPEKNEYKWILSESLGLIGTLHNDSGRIEDAVASQEKALEIAEAEEIVRSDPNQIFYRNRLASLYTNLANAYSRIEQLNKATISYRKAIVIFEKLTRENSAEIEYRSKLAATHQNLGNTLVKTNELVEAEKLLRQALAARKILSIENPSVVRYRYNISRSQENLARMLQKTTKQNEVLPLFLDAIEIRKNIVGKNPSLVKYHFGLDQLYYAVVAIYRKLQQPEKAKEKYKEVIEFYRNLVQERSKYLGYRTSLAKLCLNFATQQTKTGKIQEIVDAHQSVISVLGQLSKDYPEDRSYREYLAKSYYETATRLHDLKRSEEALVAARNALKIREKLAKDHPEFDNYYLTCATTLTITATILEHFEKKSAALQNYKQGRKYVEELIRRKPDNFYYKNILAINLMNASSLVEPEIAALNEYQRIAVLLEPVLKANSKDPLASGTIYRVYYHRAKLFEKLKRYPESVADWERAVKWSPAKNRAFNQKRLKSATEKMKKADSLFDKPLIAPRPAHKKQHKQSSSKTGVSPLVS